MSIATFPKRFSYLVYYIKKLDKEKYNKFIDYVAERQKRSRISILLDIVSCVFRYNIGIMDYFIFKFYEKPAKDREEWGGTGHMYEYHLKMNPKNTRHILANKIDFYQAYGPFVLHKTCTIDDLREKNPVALAVLDNPTGKIVVKDALGQCGWDVEVLQTRDCTPESLLTYMEKKGFNLIEEFVVQHAELAKLSASGLNTVRIVTQLDRNNKVVILAARLRISVNSHVDNLASGNIAAPIDIQKGEVVGWGVYSDITKEDVEYHPVTGIRIPGFKIPMWDKVVELVTQAALHRPENRSIGWDIAITEKGPELIEGNHNWCKILWQLPVKKGLKKTLDQYL